MNKDRLLANFIAYSIVTTQFLFAVCGAIFMPSLGFAFLCALGVNFFDYNKETYRKFFVSPIVFFKRSKIVSSYHRAYFFAFSIAFIVNFVTTLLRFFNIQ